MKIGAGLFSRSSGFGGLRMPAAAEENGNAITIFSRPPMTFEVILDYYSKDSDHLLPKFSRYNLVARILENIPPISIK